MNYLKEYGKLQFVTDTNDHVKVIVNIEHLIDLSYVAHVAQYILDNEEDLTRKYIYEVLKTLLQAGTLDSICKELFVTLKAYKACYEFFPEMKAEIRATVEETFNVKLRD
jgi:hypothetical protein